MKDIPLTQQGKVEVIFQQKTKHLKSTIKFLDT